MKEDLLKIINNYGISNQIKKFNEECFELEEAIIDHEWLVSERGRGYKKHIIEELSDVMVLFKQIQYWYEIEDEEIEEMMKFKIDRTLKRMEANNE